MVRDTYVTFLLLCLIYLLASCEKETAEDVTSEEAGDAISQLGEIEMLPQSQEFLAYPPTVERIIFTDEMENEFVGEVSYYGTNFSIAWTTEADPCPIDSSIQITYRWMPEVKSIYVDLDTLNLSFRLAVAAVLHGQDRSEKLIADRFDVLSFFPWDSNVINTQMGIVVDPRTYPTPSFIESYSDFFDEFEIHGKIFKEVYVKYPQSNNDFELYYNIEMGLVGFRADSIDLKFDRIEY